MKKVLSFVALTACMAIATTSFAQTQKKAPKKAKSTKTKADSRVSQKLSVKATQQGSAAEANQKTEKK
jgi:hypothetical protein